MYVKLQIKGIKDKFLNFLDSHDVLHKSAHRRLRIDNYA